MNSQLRDDELSLIECIKKLEGGKLHRNKNELDITTAYGIYRHAHSNARVFKVIEDAAASIGITTPTNEWNEYQIDSVKDYMLDYDEYHIQELHATVEFYNEYFSKVNDYHIPLNLLQAFKLIYVNSRTIASKALQDTYNMLGKFVGFSDYLTVDGKIGKGSKAYFVRVHDELNDNDLRMILPIFISRCKSYYVIIGTDELNSTGTDKHIKFLNGWDNRCDKILEDFLDISVEINPNAL